MLIKLLTRVLFVTLAFSYVVPHIAGIKLQGHLTEALLVSVIFNAALFGIECLVAAMVFGINIGTLGLGVFLTTTIKFLVTLLMPSMALLGTASVVPGVLHVSNYFPGALICGFMLGGIVWASVPEKSKAS